jgi:hypothetical protein
MIHRNNPRSLRHIGEPASTDIPKQEYPVTHGDRNIRQPIIIEVAHSTSYGITIDIQSGLSWLH